MYKGAPDDFNKGAGSSNPHFQTQTVYSSPEDASSPIVPPPRDEIHFFDEDTFEFSITLEPSHIPFEHWDISDSEVDFDWSKYEDCTEATKKRCRKEQGKLFCVGMSSVYSDEKIEWNMK